MSGVPLEPTPPEASELLRRELDGVEYLDSRSLLERLGDWLDGFSLPGLPGAGGGPVSTIAAVLVVAAIIGVVVALVLRLRRDPRTGAATALLEGERIDADELRARAERLLADGDAGAALLDAFRALAVRQIELGAIDDLPGATAAEVAAALGRATPARAAETLAAAGWFDDVLYGDRAASAEQVRAVLDLDRALEAVA